MVSRRRITALAAGLTAGGALSACGLAPLARDARTAGPSEPVPAPAPRLGERWVYVETNRYTGEARRQLVLEVAQLVPQLVVLRSDVDGRVLGRETYDRPWWIVDEPAYDIPIRFESPMPMLPEPIAPAAPRWYRTHYRAAGDSGRYAWELGVSAPGWERIRVPAGEYLCLRVERRIRFDHPDPFRIGSERTDILWYAPELNRWVQREWTGEYQLPGRRPVFAPEDWIRWSLVSHTPPATMDRNRPQGTHDVR
ncbi:MAG: hypothetical protein R3E48_18070 [Burkholderiaceae bacterium]